MIIDERSAIVDTDFVLHVSEINMPVAEITELLSIVFDSKNISPFVHPMVREHELQGANEKASQILNSGVIAIPNIDEVLISEEMKEYYCYIVPELYDRLMAQDIGLNMDNVFSFWLRGKSLGEVHSAALCIIRKCSIFLSDDRDSKQLKTIVENYYLDSFNVYNRKELLESLPDPHIISRHDRKAFSHGLS